MILMIARWWIVSTFAFLVVVCSMLLCNVILHFQGAADMVTVLRLSVFAQESSYRLNFF